MFGLYTTLRKCRRADGKMTVHVRYVDPKNKKKTFPTGVFVHPWEWDKENGRVAVECPMHMTANARINAVRSEADEAIATLTKEGIPRPFVHTLVNTIEQIRKSRKDVVSLMDDWIEEKKSNYKSTKVYSAMVKTIVNFTEECNELPNIQSLNQDFLVKWKKGLMEGWLASKGKGLCDQTILTYTEKLEEFIKWCGKRQVFDKRPRIDTSSVKNSLKPMRFPQPVLEPNEVDALLRVSARVFIKHSPRDMSEARKRLLREDWVAAGDRYRKEQERVASEVYEERVVAAEVARDAVVFMVRTGKRANEVISLKMEDIYFENGMYFGKIAQKKTKDKNIFPIPDSAMEIVRKQEKTSGIIFPVVSAKPVNYVDRILKKMAKAAGLNREIVRRRTYKGNVIEDRIPLWKCIGTHSGRRTFATRFVQMNGTDGAVMDVLQQSLGHKTREMTERYVEKNVEMFQEKAAMMKFQ